MFKKLAILILAIFMVATMFALASCDSDDNGQTTTDAPVSDDEGNEPGPAPEPLPEGDVDILSVFAAENWNVVPNPGSSTLTLETQNNGIRIEQGGGNAWGRVEIMLGEGGVENATSIELSVVASTIVGSGGAFNIMLLNAAGDYIGEGLLSANIQTPFDNAISIDVSGTVYGILIQTFDDIRLDVTSLVVVTED